MEGMAFHGDGTTDAPLFTAGRQRGAGTWSRGITALSLFLLFFLGAAAPCQAAGRFLGQVSESGAGAPVEHALVSMDLVPADGAAEYTATTDPFGFFKIPDITAGTYDVSVTHPGYQAASLAGLVITDGAASRENFTLDPGPAPTHEIHVQVAGAVSNHMLANVPVRIDISQGGTPVRTVNGTTDANGNLVFEGLPGGDYHFTVNDSGRPGWERLEQDKTGVGGNGHAMFLLKPVYRDLVVETRGYDPITENADQPLGGVWVEIAGVDPDDHQLVLIPPQVGTTHLYRDPAEFPGWDNTGAGRVVFNNLPAVHWRVTARRLGYDPVTAYVETSAADELLYDDPATHKVVLNMSMHDTRLRIRGEAALYTSDRVLHGLNIALDGIAESNTEGIHRTATLAFDPATGEARAEFDRLLPGSYRLRANSEAVGVPVEVRAGDKTSGPLLFTTAFPCSFTGGESFFEAIDDTTASGVMRFDPVLSHATFVPTFPQDPWQDHTLVVRASEYMADLLPPDRRRFEFHMTRGQEVSLDLLPGFYGVEVPDLAGYGWLDVDRYGAVEEVCDGSIFTGAEAWPYWQVWPYDSTDGKYRVPGLAAIPDKSCRITLNMGQNSQGTRVGVKLRHAWHTDPLYTSVTGFDDSSIHHAHYGFLTAMGKAVTLSGAASRSVVPELWSTTGMSAEFTGLPAGAYAVGLDTTVYALENPLTFTVARVPDHPGGLPPEKPVSGALYPPGASYNNTVIGDLIMPGTDGLATYDLMVWDTSTATYQPGGTGNRFQVFKYSIASQGTVFDTPMGFTKMPPHAYTAYVRRENANGAKVWYYAENPAGGGFNATIKVGGPEESPHVSDPRMEFQCEVRAVDRDTGQEVEGVGFTLESGESGVTSATLAAQPGICEVKEVSVSGYVWDSTRHSSVDGTLKHREIEEIVLRRGLACSGRVVNAVSGQPVAGASVMLRDALGRPRVSFGETTAADGGFSFSTLDSGGSLDNFLEIEAPGYEPLRVRLEPEHGVWDEDKEANVFTFTGAGALALRPMPAPEFAEGPALDRFGGVLIGVNKSGDGPALNPASPTPYGAFNAEEPLTMHWSLKARSPGEHSFQLLPFNQPADTRRALETVTRINPVSEVWLIDRRSFTTNPVSGDPTTLDLPDSRHPELVFDFLRKIEQGITPHVLHQRLAGLQADGADPLLYPVEHGLKLWTLHRGTLDPVFVLRGALGGYAILDFDYSGAYRGKELTAYHLPAWMGFLANSLGTVAGVNATADRIGEFLPKGRLSLLPEFSAEIGENEDDPGYVDYAYEFQVLDTSGTDGPGSGLLGMAPGVLGLEAKAAMTAGFHGKDEEFYLGLTGGVNTTSVTINDYKPPFFKHLDFDVEADPPPTGSIAVVASSSYSAGEPLERKITDTVSGKVGIRCSRSLMPVLTRIPYAGPVLLALNKVADMDVRAVMRGYGALQARATWSTRFPRYDDAYVSQDGNQPRRHFLGGTVEQSADTAFQLCFTLGSDLEVKLGKEGRAGASGGVALSGDDCWSGDPALSVTSNSRGTWPPIKRVRGDVRLNLTAYYDLWISKFKKSWVWRAAKIDHQFGTEAAFYWTDMDVQAVRTGRDDYGPVSFEGQAPRLIADDLVFGAPALDASGTPALLFLDMAATGGNMLLRFAPGGGDGAWGPPVTVHATDGVITAAGIVRLSDDSGWLAAWCEIGAAGMYDPWTGSALWYSIGDSAGTTWSAPVKIGDLAGVSTDLRLLNGGGVSRLFCNELLEGPESATFAIHGAEYAAGAWSGPSLLVADGRAAAWAVAAPASPAAGGITAQVGLVTTDGALEAVPCRGLTPDPIQSLGTAMDAPLAMARDDSDRLFLAAAPADGGLRLWRWSAADGWASLGGGPLFAGARPERLALVIPSGCSCLHLLWTDGLTRRSIWYGFCDPDGVASASARDLTRNPRAGYTRLLAVPGASCGSVLLARFEDEPVAELRQFDLSCPDGPVNNDRDHDGMADEEEYRIIDADPGDALQTIADVLPGDDFDGDGMSNGDELAAGRDPLDPDDTLGYGDLNCDGAVDLEDSIIGLRILQGDESGVRGCGDVNGDGRIGLPEVNWVLRELGGRHQ